MADFNGWETIGVNTGSALSTAIVVTLGAGLIIRRLDARRAKRTSLRDTYAELLVVQRASREASLALSNTPGHSGGASEMRAEQAYGKFIDQYHRLALDVDEAMWRELRRLRYVLELMYEAAREGDPERATDLFNLARAARQNLEGAFRRRLGYGLLLPRNDLGSIDTIISEKEQRVKHSRLERLRVWANAGF